MERDAERGVGWVHLPVVATLAPLLCRELTLQNEYLLLPPLAKQKEQRARCESQIEAAFRRLALPLDMRRSMAGIDLVIQLGGVLEPVDN